MKDYKQLLSNGAAALIDAGFKAEEFKADEKKLKEAVKEAKEQAAALEEIIATLKHGFGVGSIVTDGKSTYKVASFDGWYWHGFKMKKDGTYPSFTNRIYQPAKTTTP